MRNPNQKSAQNSGPPLHKILDPPLLAMVKQILDVQLVYPWGAHHNGG